MGARGRPAVLRQGRLPSRDDLLAFLSDRHCWLPSLPSRQAHPRPGDARVPCPALLPQVISLICTNRPGAAQPRFLTAAEAADQAGSSGGGAAAAGEGEAADEGERPRKRQKKGGKGAEPKGKGRAKAGQVEKKKKLGKLDQEAADRAVTEEAPPAPPPAGGPKATLIVCPLSVMSNWAAQIEEHCAGNLSGGRGGPWRGTKGRGAGSWAAGLQSCPRTSVCPAGLHLKLHARDGCSLCDAHCPAHS